MDDRWAGTLSPGWYYQPGLKGPLVPGTKNAEANAKLGHRSKVCSLVVSLGGIHGHTYACLCIYAYPAIAAYTSSVTKKRDICGSLSYVSDHRINIYHQSDPAVKPGGS